MSWFSLKTNQGINMYYDIEGLPKTLVVKKSKQNLELLSQHYDRIFVNKVGNRNISIPISALISDAPKNVGTLVLGTAQTPRKVINHAKLKEVLIRKQIHPLLALEYIKEILK